MRLPITLFILALSFFAQGQDAASFQQKATQLETDGQFQEALQQYEAWQSWAQKNGTCHEWQQACYEQAMAYYRNDDTEAAIHTLNRLVDNQFEDCTPNKTLGDTWHKLGVFYYIIDQYNQAERAYQQAIRIRTALGAEHRADLSRSYHNLGVANKEKGSYNSAVNALQAAMELRRALGEAGLTADTYYELAAVYQQMGEYTLAVNYLEATLPIFAEAYGTESYELGQSYNELGITRWKLQQYPEAHAALQEARAIFLAAYGPEDVDVARTHINSGNVFDDQGMPTEALQQYGAAMNIYEQAAPESLTRAAVFNNQGVVLRKQERWAEANEKLRQSLALKTAILGAAPHEEKAAVWDNIGDLHRDQQQYAAALEAYQKAIINRVPGFENEDFLQHPRLQQTQIPGGWQPLLVVMISKTRTLRLLYAQQQDPKTLQAALAAAHLCDLIIDRLLREYTTRQAKLFLRQQSSQAYEEGLLICKLLHDRSQDQAILDEVFFFMEKSRAVLLAARLQENNAQAFAGIPAKLQKQEQTLQADIAYLENALARLPQTEENATRRENLQVQLADYQQQFTAFTQSLETAYPRYYQEKYQTQLATATQLDNYLSKNAAWLSYFVGTESAFALLRSQGQWQLIQLAAPRQWSPAIQSLRTGLYRQQNVMPAADFLTISPVLYQQLWAPLQQAATLPEHIFLSPSGPLFSLPFELLIPDDSAGNNWKQSNFLIRQHQFSYAYSASLLLHYQSVSQQQSEQPFWGIAPTFSAPSKLAPLAYSQEEVEQIQSLLGGETLLGTAANKATFLAAAANYRILHFSTHASTESGGWIAFSGAQDSTAKLYLNELYPLQLSAELAVLGACETGSGQFVQGEGVMSIAHAFAYAGCPSTVASLWPVYHSTTTTILRSFYQYLEEGYEKDAALRQAKLDYLANDQLDKISAHPAYWAAFIHFGAPDALYGGPSPLLYLGLLALLSIIALTWWRLRQR